MLFFIYLIVGIPMNEDAGEGGRTWGGGRPKGEFKDEAKKGIYPPLHPPLLLIPTP